MRLLIFAFCFITTFTGYSQEFQSKPYWHLLDYDTDGVHGMSVEKAYQELLMGKKSTKVIVAVIDSGVDIEHEDLRSVIWLNEKEAAQNNRDDDGNGFVDDVIGWDFIGGADGTDVKQEQLESARLMVKYKKLFGDNPKKRVIRKNKEAYNDYKKIEKELKIKKEEAEKMLPMYEGILESFTASSDLLKKQLGVEKLTMALVEGISEESAERDVRQAKQYWLRLSSMGATEEDILEGVNHFKGQVNYNYNLDFNARKIVGDNPDKLEYGGYGNNEVKGPDATHGTHVAGIIAAKRDNNLGAKGVADNVSIMVVRTVPDGDERDKDVANAIRYATDNGAQIINMSFGKPYSPEKEWVDEAVKYASSKGVLFVAAAGNDGLNIDVDVHYPTKNYKKGGLCENWITVGALDFKEGVEMVANFSNYGQNNVDLFAPGVAIYSTIPGSLYKELQGTSMASPAVAGVAALVKSYYPSLTASQVKDVLMRSVVALPDMEVNLPGGENKVKFGTLSKTGGVVNAYNALKLAAKIAE